MEFKWLWPLWTSFDRIIVIIVVAHTDGLQEMVCRKSRFACLFVCLEIYIGQWVCELMMNMNFGCALDKLIDLLNHWLTWKIDFGSSWAIDIYCFVLLWPRQCHFSVQLRTVSFFSHFNSTRFVCLSDSLKNVLINVFKNDRKMNT